MIRFSCSLLVITLISLSSCNKPDDEIIVKLDNSPFILETGTLEQPQIAEDNPLSLAGVKLGRMLFYETKLSKDGSQSCASCHRQEHAFSDTTKFSIGVEGLPGKRQAMAIFNMAWNKNEFFWDGRAHLLRDQSLLPIQDPLEMNETLDNVIAKLSADSMYSNQFIRAFGNSEITSHKISLALEQFMVSIVSANSKYDKYLLGLVELTKEEELGKELFFGEYNPSFPETSGADCAHCHSGKNFENDKYMNNGLDVDADFVDFGRSLATNIDKDKAKFKVPSLRNIAVTKPYMHDGRFNTLEQVIEHYNTGLKNSSTIDPALIYPLNNGGLQLSPDDIKHLVAFLHTLTDQDLLTNNAYSNPF